MFVIAAPKEQANMRISQAKELLLDAPLESAQEYEPPTKTFLMLERNFLVTGQRRTYY